jgi:hypothetical protein
MYASYPDIKISLQALSGSYFDRYHTYIFIINTNHH